MSAVYQRPSKSVPKWVWKIVATDKDSLKDDRLTWEVYEKTASVVSTAQWSDSNFPGQKTWYIFLENHPTGYRRNANPKVTQNAIAETLGLAPRTVANYLNSKWLSKRGLGHLPYVDQELQVPRSAVGNRAWALCRSGDHAWLKVALYEGHAFRVTEVIREQSGSLGSTIRDVYRVKTCSFRGLSSEQKKFSSIAV
ncbi:uncharacterized protein METZ01_LOCUS440484 [marine metagenome]|uniref:Uncharacterized protein n=1 Tax=marine metagenome TaxID=408172 RepID=A0A382YX02_9ZZZZ